MSELLITKDINREEGWGEVRIHLPNDKVVVVWAQVNYDSSEPYLQMDYEVKEVPEVAGGR